MQDAVKVVEKAQQKEQVEKIRAKLDEMENAINKSTWFPRIHAVNIKNSISWTRDHLNRKRTEPSVHLIYENLFATHPTLKNIDQMILQVKQEKADTSYFEEQVPLALLDRSGHHWKSWEGISDKVVPVNWSKLAESHRDKTDQYGFPFYVPSDDEGFPLPDFDRSMLSQTTMAQRARKRYGIAGQSRDVRGEIYERIPMPTVTEWGM